MPIYNLNINNIVKEYTKIVAESLGRELSWETDDIALQNIQARVRVPSRNKRARHPLPRIHPLARPAIITSVRKRQRHS